MSDVRSELSSGVEALVPHHRVDAAVERIPPLPAGTSPAGLLEFVKLHEPDGGTGWSVRVTAELDDEEVLGLLTGDVEHLRQVAAASWDDSDLTRADQ